MAASQPAPSRGLKPVVFRVVFGENPQVIAVFPCEPYSHAGEAMACFAQVDKHGAHPLRRYPQATRAATPAEYADLKQEMESIGYQLQVFKYRTRPHRLAFHAALNRLRGLT